MYVDFAQHQYWITNFKKLLKINEELLRILAIRLTNIKTNNVIEFIALQKLGIFHENTDFANALKKVNKYLVTIDRLIAAIQPQLFFAYADCYDMFLNVLPLRVHLLNTTQVEDIGNLIDSVLLNANDNTNHIRTSVDNAKPRFDEQLAISSTVNSLLEEIISEGSLVAANVEENMKRIKKLNGECDKILNVVTSEDIQVNFLKMVGERLQEMNELQDDLQEKFMQITKIED